RHSEHALADAVHAPTQLAESQRARLREHVDDVHGPLVGHAHEHLARAAVGWRVRHLGWWCRVHGSIHGHGYSQVTEARSRALFSWAHAVRTLTIVTDGNLGNMQYHHTERK